MQALELNPEDPIAKKSIARLQPIVAERQEKMKDEMLGAVLSCITGFHVCDVSTVAVAGLMQYMTSVLQSTSLIKTHHQHGTVQ